VAWYWRKFHRTADRSFTLADCKANYLQNAGCLFRSPNLGFDEFWYRHEYRDVEQLVEAGEYRSGWEHYLQEGARRGYNPVFWFDERWYKKQHGDVAAGVGNSELACGFQHYLLYGIHQDLSPSIYFNTAWYRERYMKNVQGGPRSYPIVHYLLSAEKMRPCPVPFFDPDWYRNQYLVDSGAGSGELSPLPAYEHYLLFGRRLGHSPSPHFNEMAYREAYPEVAKQLGRGPYASGFEHYVTEGPANGFRSLTHLDTAGVDYASPEFLSIYERALRLELSQLAQLGDLIETQFEKPRT
jgi:hypothetical protein